MTISPSLLARTRNSAPAEVPQDLDDLTPGQIFAAQVSGIDTSAGPVTVPFEAHLPAAFPLFATRPRYAVRHLLKTRDGSQSPDQPHIFEPPGGTNERAGTSYGATPEAGFRAQLVPSDTTDLEVEVELPEGILEHPEVLASFIDFRVLVRLSVVENQSLLHGSAGGAISGLVAAPGVRRRIVAAIDERTLTEHAAMVEEMGGSCDGVVVHPYVYWRLVSAGALERFGASGVMISRTRMIPSSTALLGDFRAAATLNLPRVASITLLPGEGKDGADVVRAATRVGLDIHLPQHLMRLDVKWQGEV